MKFSRLNCGVLISLLACSFGYASPENTVRVEDEQPGMPAIVDVSKDQSNLLTEFFNSAPVSGVRRLVRREEGKDKVITLLHTDVSSHSEMMNAVIQLILNAESKVQDCVQNSRSFLESCSDQVRLRVRKVDEVWRKNYFKPLSCCIGTCQECLAPRLTLGELIHRMMREKDIVDKKNTIHESYSKEGLKLTIAESLDRIFPPASARAVMGSTITLTSAVLYGVGSFQAIPGIAAGAIVIVDAGLQQCSATYRSYCFHGKYEARIIRLNVEKIQEELRTKDEVLVVTNVDLGRLTSAIESFGFQEVSLNTLDIRHSDVGIEMSRD